MTQIGIFVNIRLTLGLPYLFWLTLKPMHWHYTRSQHSFNDYQKILISEIFGQLISTKNLKKKKKAKNCLSILLHKLWWLSGITESVNWNIWKIFYSFKSSHQTHSHFLLQNLNLSCSKECYCNKSPNSYHWFYLWEFIKECWLYYWIQLCFTRAVITFDFMKKNLIIFKIF